MMGPSHAEYYIFRFNWRNLKQGFSLEELGYRTRLLFETEGMAGFDTLVLELTEENLS